MINLFHEKGTEFWLSITPENGYGEIIDFIKKDYETRLEEGIGKLLYSERRMFYTSGDRSAFEKTYFHRRHLLDEAAILSLIEPENEEYLTVLQDCIMAVCEEYSWALPAHTDGTYDNDTSMVDLFVAETALELSEILLFLDNRLDETVKRVILENITKRVFDNYESNKFKWEECTNNWSAVCSGSIGCAMMHIAPERFDKTLSRILKSMDYFLSGFTEDGTCLEGISYWNYGFGAFVWFADMLCRYTDGKIDLLENKKVKSCAEYSQKLFLVGDTTVSFSDSNTKGKSGCGIQYFLHKRYPDSIHLLPQKYLTLTGNSYWLNLSRALFYFDPNNTVYETKKCNYYLPKSGQYITSKDHFSFAIKAGNNDEPHNHNDVGSFIVSTQKCQELCDLGAGLYTKQYFQPEHRYNIFCNRSMGHSVPIINGCEQQTGSEFSGNMSVSGNTVTVDFADAYGINDLKRLTRKAIVNSDDVIIADSWDGNVKVTERFVTTIKPVTNMGCVVFDKATLFYSKELTPRITKEKHFLHGTKSGYQDVYCIDFDIPKNKHSAEFKIEIH